MPPASARNFDSDTSGRAPAKCDSVGRMAVQTLIVGVVLTAALAAADGSAQTCDSSPLIVRNVSVWTRDGVLPKRDVTFREGRVASIEPASAKPAGPIRALDGTGHTLLPGLIDAHLHFVVPGGLPPRESAALDAETISGRQLLRSGVTSGRLHLATLDDAIRIKARGSAPCAQLPRVQIGGPGLSGTSTRSVGNFQGASSADDAREKVERFARAGVQWIAIHEADRFADGVLAAIAAAARAAGVRLMASGSTPLEVSAALSIDASTLDYFARTANPAYAGDVLDAMRKHTGMTLVPTPGVPFRTGAYLREPAALEHAENFEMFTDADRAFVFESAKKNLSGPEGGRTAGLMLTLAAKFRQLLQLGLPMAIGSDAGSPLQFATGAIWWELEAWRSL